jgi:hypothetical protein
MKENKVTDQYPVKQDPESIAFQLLNKWDSHRLVLFFGFLSLSLD